MHPARRSSRTVAERHAENAPPRRTSLLPPLVASLPPLVAALAAALVAMFTAPCESHAFERQWKAGLAGGYALAGYEGVEASGFAAGIHATYGLTDAFNLRVHSDLSAFELPEPQTSAVFWNTGVGAEYVLDILTWVPYLGATVGPTAMFVQDGATRIHLGLEGIAGLGYQLSRSVTIGAEFRYRALVFGDPTESPTHNLLALGKLEHAWGF